MWSYKAGQTRFYVSGCIFLTNVFNNPELVQILLLYVVSSTFPYKRMIYG